MPNKNGSQTSNKTESQIQNEKKIKKEKKKAKRKAKKAAAAAGKTPAVAAVIKKEEKKIEQAVERKGAKVSKSQPSKGYLGTFDPSRQLTAARNSVRVTRNDTDSITAEYVGDWVGVTCSTDAASPPVYIFNASANTVIINPLSLGAQIANEAKSWRWYCVDEFELWVQPEIGITNTPGILFFSIETDPSYLGITAVTINRDLISSYKPHIAHSIYSQDKPRVLRYREKRNQWWYCYASGQQVGGAMIDAEQRQCYQFTVIGAPDAATPSISPGVYQIRVKMRFKGQKLPVTLPRQLAEDFADGIMNENAVVSANAHRSALVSKLMNKDLKVWACPLYPQPLLIPSFIQELTAAKKNAVFDVSGNMRDRIKFLEWQLYRFHSLRNKIIQENAEYMSKQRIAPDEPKVTDVPVSAIPVVIVDKSVCSDSRVKNLASAAAVSTSGVLSTSSGGGAVSDVRLMSSDGKTPLDTYTAFDYNQSGTTGTSRTVLGIIGNHMTTQGGTSNKYMAYSQGGPVLYQTDIGTKGLPINTIAPYVGIGNIDATQTQNGILGGTVTPSFGGGNATIATAGTLTVDSRSDPQGAFGAGYVQAVGQNGTGVVTVYDNTGSNAVAVNNQGRIQTIGYGSANVPIQQSSTNGEQQTTICDATVNSRKAAVTSTGMVTAISTVRDGVSAGNLLAIDGSGNASVNLTAVGNNGITTGTDSKGNQALPVCVMNVTNVGSTPKFMEVDTNGLARVSCFGSAAAPLLQNSTTGELRTTICDFSNSGRCATVSAGNSLQVIVGTSTSDDTFVSKSLKPLSSADLAQINERGRLQEIKEKRGLKRDGSEPPGGRSVIIKYFQCWSCGLCVPADSNPLTCMVCGDATISQITDAAYQLWKTAWTNSKKMTGDDKDKKSK